MIKGPVDPRLLRPTAVQQKKKDWQFSFLSLPTFFEFGAREVIQLYRSAEY
jgi:hypothetical protein